MALSSVVFHIACHDAGVCNDRGACQRQQGDNFQKEKEEEFAEETGLSAAALYTAN